MYYTCNKCEYLFTYHATYIQVIVLVLELILTFKNILRLITFCCLHFKKDNSMAVVLIAYLRSLRIKMLKISKYQAYFEPDVCNFLSIHPSLVKNSDYANKKHVIISLYHGSVLYW